MMTRGKQFPRVLVSGSSYLTDNGQGVFTVNLCEGLAKQNVPVAVIIASLTGRYYEEVRNGVNLYHLDSSPVDYIRKGEFYTFLPTVDIRNIFDEFKPDVVHINDHYPLSFNVYREAKRRGIRVVGTNHFMPENLAPFISIFKLAPRFISWALWRWMMLLYNRFELVTSQSMTAASIVRQNGLIPPVEVISCGVDTKQFYPIADMERKAVRDRYQIDPDKAVFLYVGRLDGEKRLESLIDAMQILDRSDIQLVLAGKGKKSKELQLLASEICKPGQVVFPGYIPQADLNALLNCADCFIMPSDAELLSIATLEAMASGLPVLAARAYALTELVKEGENGYLFTPRNIPDITSKIELLADQPEMWSIMKKASLMRAKKHDIEIVINRYISIFQNENPYRARIPVYHARKKSVH